MDPSEVLRQQTAVNKQMFPNSPAVVVPMPQGNGKVCRHDRLDEDGICRACGEDCRGV